jgi:8-oxo-dGTP pyrophosphatase MutT (NUDIX family)
MINEPGYRLNVGIIVINDNGKLLLCKRKKIDSWQFPQGGIDFGESPLKAAKRELYEEVGIKKKDVKLISSTDKWFKYDVPHEKRKNHFLKKSGIRRGLRNLRCMPRCSYLENHCKLIVANDDNYALAA